MAKFSVKFGDSEDDNVDDSKSLGEDAATVGDSSSIEERAAAEFMESHSPVSEHGWTWKARAVEGAQDWFFVWEQGESDSDISIGGRTFLGPDNIVLSLSSNPAIHNFDVVDDVLAEFGTNGLSVEELSDLISERSDAIRNASKIVGGEKVSSEIKADNITDPPSLKFKKSSRVKIEDNISDAPLVPVFKKKPSRVVIEEPVESPSSDSDSVVGVEVSTAVSVPVVGKRQRVEQEIVPVVDDDSGAGGDFFDEFFGDDDEDFYSPSGDKLGKNDTVVEKESALIEPVTLSSDAADPPVSKANVSPVVGKKLGSSPVVEESRSPKVRVSSVDVVPPKVPSKPVVEARDLKNRDRQDALVEQRAETYASNKTFSDPAVGTSIVEELVVKGKGARRRSGVSGEALAGDSVDDVAMPLDTVGKLKWKIDQSRGKLKGDELAVFKGLMVDKRGEFSAEKLREIFSTGDADDAERVRRARLADRAVFGQGKGSNKSDRVRFTEKDRNVLRFLGMFKYSNSKHLAYILQVKTLTMEKRLGELFRRGLVLKEYIYGSDPLWYLSEGGLIASGLEVPRITKSDINYSMVSHQFVVNHVAGNLWGGGLNVLNLDDWPERFRANEAGEFVYGESLVSEFEIQSSFSSAKGLRNSADVYRPEIIAGIEREFNRWREAGGVDFGPSPEQVKGNEYMLTLFPPASLRLAYHVPDLVIKRPRHADGSPGNIAVEIELANKPAPLYERALNAYKFDDQIYEKVVWVVKSKGTARKLYEAGNDLGLWKQGRVQVVPIYVSTGVFKGNKEWTI